MAKLPLYIGHRMQCSFYEIVKNELNEDCLFFHYMSFDMRINNKNFQTELKICLDLRCQCSFAVLKDTNYFLQGKLKLNEK